MLLIMYNPHNKITISD